MPFKPGRSGNPAGRRAEKPFADALRMEIAAAGSDHRTLRLIARKLLEKAADGELPAILAIADRLDGKPSQQLDIETNVQTHEDRLKELMAHEMVVNDRAP